MKYFVSEIQFVYKGFSTTIQAQSIHSFSLRSLSHDYAHGLKKYINFRFSITFTKPRSRLKTLSIYFKTISTTLWHFKKYFAIEKMKYSFQFATIITTQISREKTFLALSSSRSLQFPYHSYCYSNFTTRNFSGVLYTLQNFFRNEVLS